MTRIYIPSPIPDGWLKDMYSKGEIIPVSQLKDGETYAGSCRNASVAIWNAKTGKFTYARTKFRDTFLEEINNLEDDDGFDLFAPQRIVNESDQEKVTVLRNLLRERNE